MWALLAVLAAGAAAANARDVSALGGAIHDARWPWLGIALAVEAALVVNVAMFYATTFRAAGMRARLPRFVLLTSASQFINLVSKSGGFGGVALFLREARRDGEGAARVTVAYLAAYALGYAAFIAVLLGALAFLYAHGALATPVVVAASAIMSIVVTLAAVAIVVARSELAARRALLAVAVPVNALARWLRHGTPLDRDRVHAAARDFHDACTEMRARPRRWARPAAHALGIELLSGAMLLATAHAMHADIGYGVALTVYAVSLLFSMVAITPAGLGFVEVSLAVLLASFGVPRHQAIAAALCYRAFEFWLPLALGVASMRALRAGQGITN